MAGLALVEGRRDIGDEARIGAALCHHALPYITYSIVVEVRQGSYQCFAPVTSAEGYLLLWGELQATMRTEVQKGICLEGVSCPEIGSDIGVRGWSTCPVDDGEVVTTYTRYRLREDRDIAILNTGGS